MLGSLFYIRKNTVTTRSGILLVGILMACLPLVNYADDQKPQELCVCGWNVRTICDGSYWHYISDCYDEKQNYCGYDDQGDGPCSDNALETRMLPKYPPSKTKIITTPSDNPLYHRHSPKQPGEPSHDGGG
jgi:hypothetical protein